MKNKTAEKITGQCFPIKSKVTCKNLAHLEAKKMALKVTYVIYAGTPSFVQIYIIGKFAL